MRLEITDNNKTIRVELHTNVGVFEPSEAMKKLKADLFNAVYRYENEAKNGLDITMNVPENCTRCGKLPTSGYLCWVGNAEFICPKCWSVKESYGMTANG